MPNTPTWECSKQGIVESPHVHPYPTISPIIWISSSQNTLVHWNRRTHQVLHQHWCDLVRKLDPTTSKPSSNLNHQWRLQGPKGSKYPQWSQASQDAKKMPSPCEPPSGFTIAVSDWRVEWIVVGFDGFTLSGNWQGGLEHRLLSHYLKYSYSKISKV